MKDWGKISITKKITIHMPDVYKRQDLGYQPVSNFGNNDKSDPFRISEHRLFARSAERKQYAWR